MKTPLILEIKGNSLDDGPGIRTVVFFKGCPLSCRWCHNPESKKGVPEIGFDADECIGCDTCLAVCPEGALSRGNPFFVDRARCTLCFACADACPSGALSWVGSPRTTAEILAAVIPDIPFFTTSGGGVTLSGGEPTLHMAFLSDLLCALKARNIHTLLETCGDFDMNRFETMVLPRLDTIYFDIKLIDPAAHRKHCGVSNGRILDNLERLARLAVIHRFDLLARIPLVPGITATESNLTGIARFLLAAGLCQAQLMPYNPLWPKKCAKIGEDNPCRDRPELRTWMPKERISALASLVQAAGIDTGG